MTAKTLETTAELKQLLTETKAIAVVGLSEKPERDSHSISAYLQAHGYKIVGVNPTAKSILGEPCYPSLSLIPEDVRRTIRFVAIFRRAEDAPAIIDEAAKLGFRTVWLPPGSSSQAALDAAEKQGSSVVAEKCLRVVHSAVLR